MSLRDRRERSKHLVQDPLPTRPLLDWVADRIAALERGGVEEHPHQAVMAQIGWSDDSGSRRLHRWRTTVVVDHGRRRGLADIAARVDIEDALNRAGVQLWELAEPSKRDGVCRLATGVECPLRRDYLAAVRKPYADAEIHDPTAVPDIITTFCPKCREQVVALDNGICPWCDTQTAGGQIEPRVKRPSDELRAARARAERAANPGPTIEQVMEQFSIVKEGTCYRRRGGNTNACPKCEGKKGKQAMLCRTCRFAVGWLYNGGRPTKTGGKARRGKLSEDQLLEARRRYIAGESFNAIAKSMHAQTGFVNWQGLSSALSRRFRQRGWPARDRIEATRAVSYVHGMAPRHGPRPGYSRFRKDRAGLAGELPKRPKCKGVKRQAPGKGKPCQRPAMHGSDYCTSHAPERQADHAAHLAAVRERRTDADSIPRGPFQDWLHALHVELGSWRLVAVLLDSDKHTIATIANPTGKRATPNVRRATVVRWVERARANGREISVTDLYPEGPEAIAA